LIDLLIDDSLMGGRDASSTWVVYFSSTWMVEMARRASRGLRYMVVIWAPVAAALPSDGPPRRTIFAPPQMPSASLACHVMKGSQRNTYLNPLRNLPHHIKTRTERR